MPKPPIEIRAATALLSLLFLLTGPTAAAQPRQLSLRAATGTIAETFTSINAVRELRDGRVLLTDSRENRLVIADFAHNTVEPAARTGRGPGEFLQIGPLYAIGGDSSMLLDPGNRRWLLFDGARVASVVPPDHPAVLASLSVPHGTDMAGHLLSTNPRPIRPGALDITANDSVAIFLVARATGKLDTVFHLAPIPTLRRAWANDSGRITQAFISRAAFAVGDAAILAPDGWIAIARVSPYRVEWRAPDGRMIAGKPLEAVAVTVTEREKEFYRERNAAAMATKGYRPPNLSAEFIAASDAARERQWKEFPLTIPPFEVPFPLFNAPDGNVLIQRTPTAEHPDSRYDLVDRRGALVGQLTIPRNERVLGLGAHSIYMAVRDSDDLEHLRRHPWP